MGYQGSDNQYRSERWREREGYRGERGPRSYDRGYGYDDDRGFFDRAGDEVRSWFGDEEAERRREADQRRYEREQGRYERERAGQGSRDSYRTYEPRGGFDRYEGGYGSYGSNTGGTSAGTRFGGNYERGRFDADVTDLGTGFGTFGVDAQGGYGSSARSYEAARSAQRYDPHYAEWRGRQIERLDRDYDDYRREHQSKFEEEFGSWRNRRQTQRQSLNQVSEHMDVVGSDGEHVGTVDKVRGDRIILTKSDGAAGGHHHSIPVSWIDKVEDKVVISKTAEQAKHAWRDEENRRALFEREDQVSDGPHVLGRSFKGTY